MRVFLRPTGLYSRAMVRISHALETYAPDTVTLVEDESSADLVILYAIGPDYLQRGRDLISSGKQYAVVQCCLETAGYGLFTAREWMEFWRDSRCVWSYFDLSSESRGHGFGNDGHRVRDADCKFTFYHAPLGIDDCFITLPDPDHVSPYPLEPATARTIITTGYVSHPAGEAILEAWEAARLSNMAVYHVGCVHDGDPPKPIPVPPYVLSVEGISNTDLAMLYSHAQWSVSLRHVEGFELPAIEGLACGARPILFDQPSLRHWYGDHAVYVPDCAGDELVSHLVRVFSSPLMWSPVTPEERENVLRKFNWKTICTGFWEKVLS